MGLTASAPQPVASLVRAPREAVLEATGLGRRLGGNWVIDHLNLRLERGLFYGVVGPNGAGKSTLFRLLAGLETPDKGKTALHNKASAVMVFQKGALFNRSVRENIAYGLLCRRRPKREIAERVDAMLEALDLTGLASRRATTLSGGEAQRTALGRAVILDPELLLLDEPTANLDPKSVTLIEGVVRRWAAETGAAVVMASHNMAQVKRLTDRVAFLDKGELVEHSETELFFTRPRNIRSWHFINGGAV